MQVLNNVGGRAVARVVIGSSVISTSVGSATYIGGVYTRNSDGWSTYHHEIKFTQQVDYNNTTVALSTGRRVSFQSGIDIGGSTTWSPVQTQVVISYTGYAENSSASQAGFTLILVASDLLYTGAIWWRTRAWHGTASSIAAQIGESFGLSALIQPSPQPSLTLLQCFEPGLTFLRRVIDTYLTGQNANDVTVAAHADVLMVGTAGWSQWPRYSINYPGVGASGFQHLDHEHDIRFPGSALVTGVQYNPLDGVPKNVKINPAQAVTRLGAQNPPGDPEAIFTMGRHTLPSASSNFWSRAYAEANLNQLGCQVSITGPDYLLAGALLTVNTALVNDPWAGIYQVSQVYTELRGGEAKTRLVLRRGNFNAATITAPGVPPENEATPSATVTSSNSTVTVPILSGT